VTYDTWGNRKSRNCFFSLKCYMLFTKNTRNSLKISPGHSWTTLRVETIDCVQQTGPRNAAQHSTVCYPHAWCLPSLSLCPSLCQQDFNSCWDGRPFGHNRHGPKMGEMPCPFPWGRSWVPSNTLSPGPRPTSVPSGILIHPVVWPQYTNVTDSQDSQTGQRSRSMERGTAWWWRWW